MKNLAGHVHIKTYPAEHSIAPVSLTHKFMLRFCSTKSVKADVQFACYEKYILHLRVLSAATPGLMKHGADYKLCRQGKSCLSSDQQYPHKIFLLIFSFIYKRSRDVLLFNIAC